MQDFFIADKTQIKTKQTTDIYFSRAIDVLRKKGKDKRVAAEVYAASLPADYDFAVLVGINELLYLLEGIEVDLYCLAEGTIFFAQEPVVVVEGKYCNFGEYETAILGLLCQASGVATKAARLRIAAKDKIVLSFGARRMHPAISPMIERAAYIGGCDGTSVVAAAKLIEQEPQGTMPHAYILTSGDLQEAFKNFDEILPPNIKRIMLIDTFYDEKTEAILAAQTLKDRLFGVRLDTPSSRKGDLKKICEEVRWELDVRGYKDVKIFVSGGLDEYKINPLREVCDGFGVGTALSNAPVINLSMDIVEVEGKIISKRGKLGAKKQLFRCLNCFKDKVALFKQEILASEVPICECGKKMQPLLECYIKEGKIVKKPPKAAEIREYTLSQLKKLSLS